MGSGRGWLAGDWPSTGGVLNIKLTAAAWTAGFHWWRSGNITRTQNVSEYMLVLAVYLVALTTMTIGAYRQGEPRDGMFRPVRLSSGTDAAVQRRLWRVDRPADRALVRLSTAVRHAVLGGTVGASWHSACRHRLLWHWSPIPRRRLHHQRWPSECFGSRLRSDRYKPAA